MSRRASLAGPSPCPSCGYDLRGLRGVTSFVCPECGGRTSPGALAFLRARRSARRWLVPLLVLPLAIIAVAGAAGFVAGGNARGLLAACLRTAPGAGLIAFAALAYGTLRLIGRPRVRNPGRIVLIIMAVWLTAWLASGVVLLMVKLAR